MRRKKRTVQALKHNNNKTIIKIYVNFIRNKMLKSEYIFLVLSYFHSCAGVKVRVYVTCLPRTRNLKGFHASFHSKRGVSQQHNT